MAGKFKKGGYYERPDGEVRQSQVLTTYGAGAMVDLVDRAVLVRGIDFWRYDRAARSPEIKERRFYESLAERFRDIGRELDPQMPFRAPPVGDDRNPSRSAGIQALTFPWWYLCPNASCRALLKVDATTDLKNGRYRHDCKKPGEPMVPVRFVAACKKGHLQDFPWRWFAHRNYEGRCDVPQLTLQEGATGDFAEIRVACRTCGASESLLSAQREGTRPTCEGRQPWLGPQAQERCTEELRLLVRTASNAYFSQTESALSLPETGGDSTVAVRAVFETLKNAKTAEQIGMLRGMVDAVKSALSDFSDEEALHALELLKSNKRPKPEPIRLSEYKTFLAQPEERPGELASSQDEDFFARRMRRPPDLPQQFERVVLARKLREVMVQLGFTRLEFPAPNLSGEFDLKVEQARLGLNENWLPAAEVRGEGIFIRLDDDALSEWASRASVRERELELMTGYAAWTRTLKKSAPPFPGVRYYMLHSLSHMLITAISLECGYPASSLHERLYCSEPGDPIPLAAILLSTGSTGAEGTLGGLVEQGARLVHHLRRAHDEAQLCSSDPVCAHHSPASDPAERFLEGAACHGCLFVAECSCERFNRFLDRALVVPTLGKDPELAFFKVRP
jgi:hypothetical protein